MPLPVTPPTETPPTVAHLAQIALEHQNAGRIDLALSLFADVLERDPRHPQANFSLGIAAYQAGRLEVAIPHLKIAAAKARKHPQVHQLLGLALLSSGDYEGARQAFQKAVALAPKVADYHAYLGIVHRLERKPVLSRQSFERSLQLDPDNGYALLGLGQLDVSLGNIDEAEAWFNKAIAAGKELPAALHRLAFTKTHREPPEILSKIEDLLSGDQPVAPSDGADLHWAAGKIYHDLGDTPHAAEHYRSARRLRYEPFDHQAHDEHYAFLKEVFTRKFFEDRRNVASTSDRPVFVFGMPRSGTTLAEQILARHTDVASGGEITFFRNTIRDLGLQAAPSERLAQHITNLDPADYRRIAKGYLRKLDSIDRRSKRVTDKMPHNFETLWLMALLFPNASFVHCVRSPADTCMSLLSHALSPAHNYCRTQDSVGRYFQSYAGLMEHWQEALPVSLHRLAYEDLVHDQEGESRRLLASSNLEWQDACLEFYNGDAPVTTFSDLQVRRPIYRSSIGRWRRHREYLDDLFQALGPLAPEETRSNAAEAAVPAAAQPEQAANDEARSGNRANAC